MFLRYLSPSLVWIFVICYICFIPSDHLPDSFFSNIPFFDKILHFGLFAILAFLLFFGLWKQHSIWRWRNNASVISFWFAVLLGLLVELIQGNFVETRSFESIDLLADSIGAMAGLLLAEKMFFKIR